MLQILPTLTELATFINIVSSSIVAILAFSLLAFTLTYNFGNSAARRFALLLGCVLIAYSADVALSRVNSADSANRWLRFQWLGIAFLPFTYYIFSTAVLHTTNYSNRWSKYVAWSMLALSAISGLIAFFGNLIVDTLRYRPPLSYLEPGPLFGLFAAYFAGSIALSFFNIYRARQRCITEHSRMRMTYLLLGFGVPALGIFPYMIGVGQIASNTQSSPSIFILAMFANLLVAFFLILMSYSVVYFGALTPDRVVRYRLIRFFTRGPVVAILVILAMQTVPKIERILGLPRDLILFSTITGVIISSQLILSLTKSLVDRLVYQGDREEVSWLREIDRRLLTSSDMRQFLENNLTALCEILQAKAGFVAAISGPDLILESSIGSADIRQQITESTNWPAVMQQLQERLRADGNMFEPLHYEDFLIWPLLNEAEPNASSRALGILGVTLDQSTAPSFLLEGGTPQPVAQLKTQQLPEGSNEVQPYLAVVDGQNLLHEMLQQTAQALQDRKIQLELFTTLRRIIPGIDRVQQLRGVVPYTRGENESVKETAQSLLEPSPIHDPEFNAWVKEALSHYWGGPKLTRSPLTQLRVVNRAMERADDEPTKALRLVLGDAIERLRPDGTQDLNMPEWLLYNIIEMRFIQGRKVREIANRLVMSESDLYRKQRVAIGQLARVLTEMEQQNDVLPEGVSEEPLEKDESTVTI